MELLHTEDGPQETPSTGFRGDSPSVAVVTTNANGIILAVNDRFAKMLRFEPWSLIGQTLSSFAHPEDATLPTTTDRRSRRYLSSDGEVVWANVTASPIFRGGRTVEELVWLFEEISDHRQAVRAREADAQRRLSLDQADHVTSLGRMAATMAHDFNNVLMGISPFIEVIRRGRSVETSLEHISRAVKRGKRVTEQILRFTRAAQPELEPLAVEPWLENIATEARSLVPSNCHVETFLQSSELVIAGDPQQLNEIFTNLILNARDAMPHGGTLSIEVLRERPSSRLPFGFVEHPERFAHCIVRDTGCGMPPETLRHIYEPLFTTRRNAAGLGLAVAHQVVQRHGGVIFAESTVGTGTAFHIFLPLAPNAVTTAEKLSSVEEDVQREHPRHVLLVEDDPSVAAGLVSLLELEGLLVDVVETGAAAIRAVEQVRPDLVVLDVGLPDMEGTNVYETIAARMPALPVIFSTGHTDRARLDDYLERPHVGYLLKPYERSMLLRAIEDVLPA